ncbi:GNAT family N-acetyltransferase [Micrococcoides hystricis]|uniref:GNAT family N-acetyltransferase n=1 Tax=Micrococcoides hystricis TaxID=1572761 RepID=A0ABV6P726_9MICC
MHDLSRLVTDQLVRSFPQDSDIDEIYRACQDPLIQAFTQCPSPYSRDDAAWFVRDFSSELRAAGTAVWVIRTSSGEFVGVIDFHNKEGRSAEMGYWLAPDQRGKGYLKQAGQAASKAAHEHLDLDFVYARIEENNIASLRAAQAMGFTVHALLPGSIYLKGTHRDAYYCTKWLTSDVPESATIADPLEQVRQFHTVFGLPIKTDGADASVPHTQTRWQLIAEELCELLEAIHGATAVAPIRAALAQLADRPFQSETVDTLAAADAVADCLYVLYGMALETDMPIRQIMAEVHRANMSKLGADGSPVMRADGKVLKGPDYRAPNLRSILYPGS